MSRVSLNTKKRTQNNIVAVSEKLFTKHGFEHTTIKMIAHECGIAEGTIFNYFSTKDDILVAIFDHRVSEHLVINTTLSNRGNLSSLIEQLLLPVTRLRIIPKSMMREIVIISVKKIKKKPHYLNRFATMDYQHMKQIAEHIKPFIKHDSCVSAKELSEIVYGTFFIEFMIYLYEKEISFERFINNVSMKTHHILKPYLEVNEDGNKINQC